LRVDIMYTAAIHLIYWSLDAIRLVVAGWYNAVFLKLFEIAFHLMFF